MVLLLFLQALKLDLLMGPLPTNALCKMKISKDCFDLENIYAETHIFPILYEWQSTPVETANKVNEFAHQKLVFPPFSSSITSSHLTE